MKFKGPTSTLQLGESWNEATFEIELRLCTYQIFDITHMYTYVSMELTY